MGQLGSPLISFIIQTHGWKVSWACVIKGLSTHYFKSPTAGLVDLRQLGLNCPPLLPFQQHVQTTFYNKRPLSSLKVFARKNILIWLVALIHNFCFVCECRQFVSPHLLAMLTAANPTSARIQSMLIQNRGWQQGRRLNILRPRRTCCTSLHAPHDI